VKIVVLTGGGGGARLIDGLSRWLAADQLIAVVNTGDDFVHLGLTICPDVDTIVYTLAGVLDARGWGRAGDSFRCLDQLAALGGEAWFRLGDLDLALHLHRSTLLAAGASKTEATAVIARSLGVTRRVLPMSDQPCPTELELAEGGVLSFQRWYVGARAAPAVRAVFHRGSAHASPAVLDALASADAVVLAPSNPYLSLGPILALPEVAPALRGKRVIAVSPLVAGAAITGPLARMMTELGSRPHAAAIAERYRGLVTTWLVDPADAGEVAAAAGDARVLATDVVMSDVDARRRLAAAVLEACG
jgi:LPPG:FO 2-phospho-L-lactate transferase